jgi:membrane-associated phospholipid phosphatase
MAGLIAISRIYLGAHFPTDTIGALALAGTWVTLSFLPMRFYRAALNVNEEPMMARLEQVAVAKQPD